MKAYPKLNSKRPLYGKLQFARLTPGKRGGSHLLRPRRIGRTARRGEEGREEGREEPPRKRRTRSLTRRRNRPLLAPAAVKLSSYDRLYIDANRDGDLTNDAVVKPMKNPPCNLIPDVRCHGGRCMVFPWLKGRRQPGGAGRKGADGLRTGRHRHRLRPRRRRAALQDLLLVHAQRRRKVRRALRFAAATARKGTIEIGKSELERADDAGRAYRPLRYADDLGSTHVEEPASKGSSPFAVPIRRESETLLTLRHRDGEFYTLVANPPGDKLTVEMYRGPFGVFKVAAGDKKLDKPISFQGTFYGPKAFLNMASSGEKADDKKMAECNFPSAITPRST